MKHLEEGLALVAGASLGLAAMYLLDPESGSDRRGSIRKAAQHTIGGIGHSISSAGEAIAHRAGDAVSMAHEAAASATKSVTDRARGMLPHQEETCMGAKIAAAATGGVALFTIGAGLAYLFDPDRGRGRRAYLRDQAYSLFNHSSHWAGRKSRHMTNKARGVYAQTRAKLHPTSSEQTSSV